MGLVHLFLSFLNARSADRRIPPPGARDLAALWNAMAVLERAGYAGVRWVPLTLGIVYLYLAQVPQER